MDLRHALNKLLLEMKTSKLCLDLTEVTLCDSAGLALLIEARKLCAKNNKSFEVKGMPSETLSLAEFCGVKELLELTPE